MSNSLGPHGLYSPWNSPGQNTGGVAIHFFRGSFQPRNQTQVSRMQDDSLPTEPQRKPNIWFSLVAQSCLIVFDPMDYSTPGFSIHHQLLGLTQTHVYRDGDAIQPSHLLSSPSPPAFHHAQHKGLFKCVSCLHQVAKLLEFQL